MSDLLGKTILLGLTFASADGEVIERIQRHGVIEEVHPESGICIRFVAPGHRWNDERYWLPPNVGNLVEAAPGAYVLRSTGETVVDPDFTSTWEIRTPSPEDSTPEQLEARRAEQERLGFPSD